MTVDLIMPRTGYTMTEGTIIEWYKNDGDWVEKGEKVLVVESEKVAYEVEAPTSGFVVVYAEGGSVATIGQAVGTIVESVEEIEEVKATRVTAIPDQEPPSEEKEPTRAEENTSKVEENVTRKGRIAISPLARELAQAEGIDISSIQGTGPAGRIVKADIEKILESRQGAQTETPQKRVAQVIPVVGMRKEIGEHLFRSLHESAQLTNLIEADVTELIKLHKEFAARSEKLGKPISYTTFLVKACALALRATPIVNSSFEKDGIKVWQDINIGVAVAVERGLVVPVVFNADNKSLVEIDSIIGGLVEKAQNKTLTRDDLEGSTFTLNNVGSLMVDYSTAILNQPETAMLTVGRFMEKPAVVNGQIVIRTLAGLSLTYDHRATDAVPIMQFVKTVVDYLQDPITLLL